MRALTLEKRESYDKRALILPTCAQAGPALPGPHARLSVSDGISEGVNVGALTQRWEAQVREEGEPRRDGEISQMQQFLPNFWASKLNERVRLPSRQLGLSLTFSGIRHRPFLANSELRAFRKFLRASCSVNHRCCTTSSVSILLPHSNSSL